MVPLYNEFQKNIKQLFKKIALMFVDKYKHEILEISRNFDT